MDSVLRLLCVRIYLSSSCHTTIPYAGLPKLQKPISPFRRLDLWHDSACRWRYYRLEMPGALSWDCTISFSLSCANVVTGPALLVLILIARQTSATTIWTLKKKGLLQVLEATGQVQVTQWGLWVEQDTGRGPSVLPLLGLRAECLGPNRFTLDWWS